ncbi:hypothetical protein IAT40_004148 [Kwoniella sp. CBS 6097]
MAAIQPGEYDLNLSSALSAEWGLSKKRRRDEDQLVALRYAFKPASVTQDTPGTYYPDAGVGSNGQVVFDAQGGNQQVFDVREEHGKGRECVLVFDDETQAFTLHTVPSTLHLTLNRSASASNARRPPSTVSSASSSSNPLSRLTRARADGNAQSFTEGHSDHGSVASSREASVGGYNEDSQSYVIGAEGHDDDTPRPHKKPRPSEAGVSALLNTPKSSAAGGATRATKGGKGLPRKKPLESAPIPVLSAPPAAKTKAKAGGKKGTKAKASTAKSGSTPRGAAAKGGKKATTSNSASNQMSTPTGGGAKFKSAEYIEDSDEEIAQSDAAQAPAEEEEVDEFASLLGQSLAQGDQYDEESDDDDDDDEDEDEDDDALGGARLVVSGHGNSNAGRMQVNTSTNGPGPGTGPVMMAEDDDTEWI